MVSKFLFACASAVLVQGFGGVKSPVCINPPDAPVKPDCENALEQSPAEVTKGAVGFRDPTGDVVEDYKKAGMCMVNIHWHLGAEHMSAGQYDIDGKEFLDNAFQGKSKDNNRRLLEAGGDVRAGWMCPGYDAKDPAYSTEYDWKYCEGMNVGLTYEVHWPYSSAGHCGYLTDGLGGVFCKSHTPKAIGVQGQVFQIVNDDRYDVANLAGGMLPATNIAKYTGSTTGESHDNSVCSAYAPISWHVDRDCHKVSAKSFDAMCKIMKDQGMKHDLAPHGSRELVDPQWVTDIPMAR